MNGVARCVLLAGEDWLARLSPEQGQALVGSPLSGATIVRGPDGLRILSLGQNRPVAVTMADSMHGAELLLEFDWAEGLAVSAGPCAFSPIEGKAAIRGILAYGQNIPDWGQPLQKLDVLDLKPIRDDEGDLVARGWAIVPSTNIGWVDGETQQSADAEQRDRLDRIAKLFRSGSGWARDLSIGEMIHIV